MLPRLLFRMAACLLVGVTTQIDAQTCSHPACGSTIDTLNGVTAYSNACSMSIGCYDGFYKWECVEFVHRYYLTRFNIDTGSIPTAAQTLSLLKSNPLFETHQQPDPSIPQAEDIIVFGVNTNTPDGHVAIATTDPVLQSGSTYTIPIIEQNSYLPHVLVLQDTAQGFAITGRLCDPSLCTCSETSTVCKGTARSSGGFDPRETCPHQLCS